jgi:4-amino-4-deoxy-L-arabinose transferase-like glycosyltransferase
VTRRWRVRLPRMRPAVLVALLAFVNCAAWALITPSFQAPDEPSHVGYAVELAETGHPPREDWNHAYASDEVSALANGMDTFEILQFASSTRPPWRKSLQQDYERLALHLNRKNGGGTTTASVHGPVYYAFPALAYRIFYDASFRDRMLAMRLASALLAAFTVAFIYGTVRELAPGRPWAAAAAALLAAFQPVFGSIEGSVNADVGVNLAGAALVFVLVRAMRRGLTMPLAAAIPAAFILGTLAKATMLGFVPVVIFGLAVIAWRRRWRLRDWIAMAAAGAALAAAWAVVAPAYHHSFIPVPGGGSGVAGQAPGTGAKLSYIWQIFLPPLSFMHHDFAPGIHPVWDVYVVRAWGGFGWLDVNLPHPLFVGIAVAMCVIPALAFRGLWLERALLRSRVPEALLLLGSLLCVLGFTHAAFARFNPAAPILEQGRYAFPAITVLAITGVAACFGLGRRLAPVGAAALVTAMMLLSGFAQLYVFTTYFT